MTRKHITIIDNTELFKTLKKTENMDDMWGKLFDNEGDLKDYRIPVFAGGLDHIEETEKSITFHDIGMSSGVKNRNNSFRIQKSFPKYAITYKDQGIAKPDFKYHDQYQVAEIFFKKHGRDTSALDMTIIDNTGREFEAECDGSYYLNEI